MKNFYLVLFLCFSPFHQVNASTPKSITCTRTDYREEYIPGTKSNPGYVKSYEIDVIIPCGGQSQVEKFHRFFYSFIILCPFYYFGSRYNSS